MTDLVALAGNAVAAYQRALGTVSNNIANVSTDGYSRQEITLEANPVSRVGNVFLGTGVIVAGVKRQYDAFTEANLRNSNSDLSSQEPMVNYANRVIDVMGGPTTGLTTALDQFFNSARDLSSDPASTVLRGSFVRDAQGLTSRFGELSSQLDMIQSETDQAVQSSVDKMNTICAALANVNKQLTKVQTEAAQPPDLMDQRDQLLKELSAYVHVNASFTTNGTVKVSLGSSINQDVVVDGNTSKLISTSANPDSPGKTNLILDQYGTPSTLTGITSGSLSGLMAFQEQVLNPSRSALDNLATTLATEINKVHAQGIDGYGQPGGALFTIDTTATSIAGGLKVAFEDPLKVSAAAQFRVIQDPNNSGSGLASLSYEDPASSAANLGPSALQDILVNNDNPSAGRSITIDQSRPAMAVATVQNGMEDVSIFLDHAQAGQQLQVMTRDGRQILGSAVDPKSLMGNALMSTNGIVVGATYSADYLNKSGDAAYKDMNVFYGARAAVLQIPNYDNSGQALTSTPLAANLNGGPIDPQSPGFADGAFVLNGVSLGALTPSENNQLSAKDVALWLNTSIKGFTDATAWGIDNVDLSKSSYLPAKATNEIRVSDRQLNLSASLSINGIPIGSGPFANKQALVSAINGKNLDGGVLARLSADGTFVLSNNDGSNIDIQPTVPANAPGTALGLAPGLVGGSITLTRPLAATAVAPTNSNQIKIPANQINLSLPLAINGQTIGQPGVDFGTVQNLAAAINKAQSVVTADVGLDGSLTLTSVNGPDNNSIQIASNSAGNNGAGNALGLPAQVFRSAITASTTATRVADTPIELGFGTGTPADLAKLGMRTGVYIQGAAKDDLLVFVTGAGTASVAASYSGKPVDAQQSLRSNPLALTFTSARHYRIRDVNTDTIVAERDFDPSQLDPGVTYQGLQLSFTTPPQAGDVFTIDGNADGTGNNENMLAIAALENKSFVGNKTLSTAYIDHVNNVGNIARQATIAQTALKVVHDQAVTAKDQVSGVSLDQEAADLIRYQQAYQAAAKVLQVGSQLFDSILQVR